MKSLPAPEQCAICGAEIPKNSRACPECGADERTGWREQSLYDGLDLPDAEAETKPTRAGTGLLWKVTGLVVLVLMAVLLLRGRF